MINKIRMKNVASYKDETVLETDKRVNLIYGLNGTGKSTLSGFLYDIHNPRFFECKVDGLHDTDKLLVYNQQFVADNFYETEDIHGIFTLSKENKSAKTLIDSANKELKKLLTEKEKIEKDIDSIVKKYQRQVLEYQNEVWKIKTEYTGGDRVLEYCLDGLKGKKETLFEYVVNLNPTSEKNDYRIEDLKKEVMILQGDSQKEVLLKKINFETLLKEEVSLLSKVIVGNQESSVSELINQLGNSDWVHEGLKYIHKEDSGGMCPFCQQSTITEDFMKKIDLYFDESFQNDKKKLDLLLEKYENNIQNELIKIFEMRENVFSKIYLQEIDMILERMKDILDENIRKIQEKIKMPSLIISLENVGEEEEKINSIIERINIMIQDYNRKIDDKEKSLKEIKIKFWSLMREKYDSTISLYNLAVKSYQREIGILKDLQKKNQIDIETKNRIIGENQKKTVNIDEAVENIKQGLVNIGITDFTIEKCSNEDEMYRLKRDSSVSGVFKSLSEGEKMVISFLYFVELCKGETQRGATSTGKIIIIDDPISSLSHIHIFNIGRIIHNEFLRTKKYEQIFILTHSLYFFYEMTCMKQEDRHEMQKLFRLCKNGRGSEFTVMKYEEIQNDYQAYWSIVKDKEQPPALIANCMRNIIEYFFNFVEKQDFVQVFQRRELQEIRFAAFCRYMNRESHSKGQNIFDIKEFDYDNFREAFKLVFDATGYGEHYKKMIR